MVLVALFNLWRTPALLQYAFLPGGELSLSAEKLEEVEAELAGAAAVTIHGVKNGSAVSTEYDTSESSVTLYMIGTRWNEVYPRAYTDGEPLSPAALAGAQRMIVLDSDLAFRLFGDREPVGEFVDLSGERFEVVGVARHARRLGESQTYAAWIPLGSDEALGCDLMVVSAVSGIDGGLMTLFGNAAKAAFGDGVLYGLGKERMRATMILRVIALVLALRLLGMWIGLLKRVGGAWIEDCRARMKRLYIRQMLGFVLARLLAAALVLAATLGACWALMTFFVAPVLVFVEWVPEVLVSYTAIRGRFWELVDAASRPVSLVTAELAEVHFWANILRWGVIFALIGGVMTALNGFFPKGKPSER